MTYEWFANDLWMTCEWLTMTLFVFFSKIWMFDDSMWMTCEWLGYEWLVNDLWMTWKRITNDLHTRIHSVSVWGLYTIPVLLNGHSNDLWMTCEWLVNAKKYVWWHTNDL